MAQRCRCGCVGHRPGNRDEAGECSGGLSWWWLVWVDWGDDGVVADRLFGRFVDGVFEEGWYWYSMMDWFDAAVVAAANKGFCCV
ncbi:hypothetical protein Droror1_Dr00004360 [Drosera rotundifolia]